MPKTGKAKLLAALGLSLWSAAASAAEAKDAYPGAFDRPPPREEHGLTVDERSKLKDELTKARDRQSSKAKTNDSTPAAKKP